MSSDIQQFITDPRVASQLDAFISYKREQSAIAQAIVELLKEADKVVWLDTEGIPLSKNWWDAIREAIDKSTAMIALVTDDYMRSVYCNYEVAYARQKQRLIIVINLPGRPAHDATYNKVVYHDKLTGVEAATGTDADGTPRGIDVQEQWATLSMIQSVDFSDIPDINGRAPDDSADKTEKEAYRQDVERLKQAIRPHLPQLIQALEFDLAYREQFASLQRIAEQWQQTDDSSQLLTGRRLEQAEDWLREGRDKYEEAWQNASERERLTRQLLPPPTPLQRRFIEDSRRAETTRRNRQLTFALIALVLVGVAAAVAFFQRNVAIDERERANTASTQVVEQLNETQKLLQQSATTNNELRLSIGEPAEDMLVYGPSIWVSLPESNTLQQRRSDTGDLLNTVPTGDRPRPPFVHDGLIRVVSDNELLSLQPVMQPEPERLSLPGTVAAYHTADHHLWLQTADTLLLVDMAAQQIVQEFPADNGDLMAASRGYAWVYDDFSQQLTRYSADNTATQTLTADADIVSLIAADDSTWALQEDGQLHRLAGDIPAYQQTYTVGSEPGELVASERYLWAFSSVEQRVLQIDRQQGDIIHTWEADRLNGTPLRLDIDETRLWVSTNNAGLRVYDIQSGQQQAVFESITGLSRTAPRSGGALTWMGNSLRENLLALNVANGEIQMRVANCPQPAMPQYDGANIWTICRGSQEILRVPASITLHLLGEQGEEVNPAAPLIDGNSMWVLLEDAGELAELDLQSGDLLRQIDLGAADDRTDIQRDGAFIWILQRDSRRLVRFDPAGDPTADETLQVWTFSGEPHALAFIEEFIWVPSMLGTGNNLHLFDRATGELVSERKFGLGAGVPAYDANSGTVWIGGGTDSGTLYRMTPDGSIVAEIDVDGLPFFIFLRENDIYSIALFGADWTRLPENLMRGIEGRIYRIDASSGEVRSERYLPSFPQHITDTREYLFVTEPQMVAPTDEQLTVYDPQTLERVTGWRVCDVPTEPYYDATHSRLWVVCIDLEDDVPSTVTVIDTDTLEIVREYTGLGRSGWPPRQIDNTIWIVYQQTGNAAVFDAATGNLRQLLALGENPSRLTVHTDNAIWLANAADSTVQQLQMIHTSEDQPLP